MLRRLLAVLVLSMPALAQYAGPAILSRDEAPAAMEAPKSAFALTSMSMPFTTPAWPAS